MKIPHIFSFSPFLKSLGGAFAPLAPPMAPPLGQRNLDVYNTCIFVVQLHSKFDIN